MADIPSSVTRNEKFLEAIATGDANDLPVPVTREELYLDFIAKNGGGGGGGGDVSGVKGAVETTYRKGNVNITLPNIANLDGGLTYNNTSKTLTGTQYSTIPTPAAIFLNKIIQYVGEDTADYKCGRFYKCVVDGGVNVWQEVKISDDAEALTPAQVQALLSLL